MHVPTCVPICCLVTFMILSTLSRSAHFTLPLSPLSPDEEREEQPQQLAEGDWQEKQRHAAALKRMYPKSHHFLDSQLGPSLTPVLEEEVDLLPPFTGSQSSNSPLPPLPGEPSESPLAPLPPLPGEPSESPLAPLPPLPGESSGSPLPSLLRESPVSPRANISPLPPLPGELSPSEVLPEVAALASVRSSVREIEQLHESMGGGTHLSSPPPTHSMTLNAIVVHIIAQFIQ